MNGQCFCRFFAWLSNNLCTNQLTWQHPTAPTRLKADGNLLRGHDSIYQETHDTHVGESNVLSFTSAQSYGRSTPMNRLLTIMITVMLCVGTLVPFGAAQPAIHHDAEASVIRGSTDCHILEA